MRAAKALASLRIWEGSPEPLLLADVMSTQISSAGSYSVLLFLFVFDLILYVPVNNFSVMSGWVFLG